MEKLLICLLASLIVTYGAASPVINPTNLKSGRIVGGAIATRGQFPYHAAVLVDGGGLCSGALISNRVVATIAQCAAGTNFQIHLGAQLLFSGTGEPGRVIVDAREVKVHESYQPGTYKNDIALMWLPSPVANSDFIVPVRPATSLDGSFTGSAAVISGWGTLKDGSSSPSDQLYFANVKVIGNAECIIIYGNSVIFEGTICQAGADVGSPCLGDSGAPLVVTGSDGNPLLVGLTSFTSTTQRCEGTHPIGYTRVSYYADWIAANSP